jgi:hypothetical protein
MRCLLLLHRSCDRLAVIHQQFASAWWNREFVDSRRTVHDFGRVSVRTKLLCHSWFSDVIADSHAHHRAVGQGIVRGCGLQTTGAVLAFFGFYCVSLPTAFLLAFKAHLGLKGLWTGTMPAPLSGLAVAGHLTACEGLQGWTLVLRPLVWHTSSYYRGSTGSNCRIVQLQGRWQLKVTDPRQLLTLPRLIWPQELVNTRAEAEVIAMSSLFHWLLSALATSRLLVTTMMLALQWSDVWCSSFPFLSSSGWRTMNWLSVPEWLGTVLAYNPQRKSKGSLIIMPKFTKPEPVFDDVDGDDEHDKLTNVTHDTSTDAGGGRDEPGEAYPDLKACVKPLAAMAWPILLTYLCNFAVPVTSVRTWFMLL